MTNSTNESRRYSFALWTLILGVVLFSVGVSDAQVRVNSRSFGIGPDIESAVISVPFKDDEVSAIEINRLLISKPDQRSEAFLPDTPEPADEVKTGAAVDDKKPLDRNFRVLESEEFERTPEASWKPFDMFPRQSAFSTPVKKVDEDALDDVLIATSEKFHWKPAIVQSVVIQGFQLSYALLLQDKTRRALKGPFWKDYIESVRLTRGWDDGNKFFTNYIAHPMQGGMTGFIFVQNHNKTKKQKFGESKQYWKDRFKAFLWSTAWSTNWELGPVSQSSIGNVGLSGHMGYVDLVITPTVGTGWLLTEEAFDRYVIRHLETRGPGVKILARTLLNPMRSVANVLRLKTPWHRDNR